MYRGLSLERIVELANVADVVGMSVMFSQDWPIANKLITDLKIKLPDSIFVIGGEHGTAEPHGALRDCIALDYVVSGEGEHVFTELLNAIESNSSIIEISGITHRYNNVICQTPKRPRERNIDLFPWPAWHLFPMENYLKDGHGWGVNRGRSLPIVASRGCPYQCTFCSNPSMWTTRWAVRSVDDVLSEIDFGILTYKATNFDFQDLTAIIKRMD